jgi:hypothetical protein
MENTYGVLCEQAKRDVNNNLQRKHFLYIYYISQHSYMFRSIWTIFRELYSKKIKY